MRVSRKTLKDIEIARRELAKGKYYTFEEVFGRPQRKQRKKRKCKKRLTR